MRELMSLNGCKLTLKERPQGIFLRADPRADRLMNPLRGKEYSEGSKMANDGASPTQALVTLMKLHADVSLARRRAEALSELAKLDGETMDLPDR